MLYKHSGDKLFPKTKYCVYITYDKDDDVQYDISFEEALSIVHSNDRFFKLNDIYINLSLAREIRFITYIWGGTDSKTFGWLLLDNRLLSSILSDEGQTVLLKREMNVAT